MIEAETLQSCIACGAPALRQLAAAEDRMVFVTEGNAMGVRYGLSCCTECELIFLNPRMSGQTLQTYYARQSRMPRETIPDDSPMRRMMLSQMDLIASKRTLEPGANVLEIGCAEAYFLKILNERHDGALVLSGIEPSRKYADQARKTVPAERLHETVLEQAPLKEAQFELIVIRHVFEHLPDPVGALKLMRRALKPDGVIYIEVPDTETADASICHFFHHEHLSYFTSQTMSDVLARADLHAEVLERRNDYELGSGFAYPVLRVVAAPGVNAADSREVEAGQAPALWALQENAHAEFMTRHVGPVEAKLQDLHQQGATFALFGAGPHTMELLHNLERLPIQWKCIFDNNPNKHGQNMRGIPICAPTPGDMNAVDCIVISSAEYEREIREQVVRESSTDVLTIYDNY